MQKAQLHRDYWQSCERYDKKLMLVYQLMLKYVNLLHDAGLFGRSILEEQKLQLNGLKVKER